MTQELVILSIAYAAPISVKAFSHAPVLTWSLFVFLTCVISLNTLPLEPFVTGLAQVAILLWFLVQCKTYGYGINRASAALIHINGDVAIFRFGKTGVSASPRLIQGQRIWYRCGILLIGVQAPITSQRRKTFWYVFNALTLNQTDQRRLQSFIASQ